MSFSLLRPRRFPPFHCPSFSSKQEDRVTVGRTSEKLSNGTWKNCRAMDNPTLSSYWHSEHRTSIIATAPSKHQSRVTQRVRIRCSFGIRSVRSDLPPFFIFNELGPSPPAAVPPEGATEVNTESSSPCVDDVTFNLTTPPYFFVSFDPSRRSPSIDLPYLA